MTAGTEGKEVFKRFCLIALGIPLVLLIFVSVLYLSPLALTRSDVSTSVLNIAAAVLGLAGVAMWAFFSFLLYRRLWKVFPHIGEKEKGWSYAQGVFGFTGVGVSMSSVLGVFYYLFTGDYYRAVALIGVSFALALIEVARFPARIADVEDAIDRMK